MCAGTYRRAGRLARARRARGGTLVGMDDPRDTIVDPQIRREVERPRADARRPVLLIAIVVTSALAGAAAMALVRGPRAVPSPALAPRVAPAAVVAPVPPVAPVAPVPAVPAVAPVAPAELPTSRVGGPCIDYHQKSLGEDQPRGVDCFRGPR